jgi:hypothetical protein
MTDSKMRCLGPRARLLNLSWKSSRTKKKKKQKIQSKPKKMSTITSKHNPKDRSQEYSITPSIMETMNIPNMNRLAVPEIITYDVRYLDEENDS